MNNEKKNKRILVITLVLLGFGICFQYRTIQLLDKRESGYYQRINHALIHLMKTSDFSPLSESLNQVLKADRSTFATHFIQAEKLAQEWFDTLTLINELRDMNREPDDGHDWMTNEQKVFQDHLMSVELSGYFYALKHRYYYFEEHLPQEDRDKLEKLAKEVTLMNHELQSAKDLLAYDYPEERVRQIVSNYCKQITLHLEEIKRVITTHPKKGKKNTVITKEAAIDKVFRASTVSDQYVTQAELLQSSYDQFTLHLVYRIHLGDKETSVEAYVAEVDAVENQSINT